MPSPAPGADAATFPELEKYLSEPLEEPGEPALDPGGAYRLSSLVAQDDLYPEIRVRVTSPRHTVISSQVAGRIDKVGVRDGDRFQTGQILVEIDPTFERIQLEKAQANLKRFQLIQDMTEELVALQTKGELELELARADVRQAAAEAAFVQARLDRMRIGVPFPGRIGDVAVRELQVVAEGQPLLEVIDDSEMELEFIVASEWMRWFAPGFRFSVKIDELDKTFAAVLDRIGGKVDPLSKSVKVYARLLDGGGDLMEGMSGEAFISPPEDATP